MARATIAQQIRQLLLIPGVTMRKLGASLNVPERTLRRWKNEGTKPSVKHNRARKKLARGYATVRSDQLNFARQQTKRKPHDKISTKAGVPGRRVAVIPFLTRVKMNVTVNGKKRYVNSPYIRADVRLLTLDDLLSFLRSYFDKRQRFGLPAIVYALQTGDQYPGGEPNESGKKQKWRSSIEHIQTWERLARWAKNLYGFDGRMKPLEIFVLDSD